MRVSMIFRDRTTSWIPAFAGMTLAVEDDASQRPHEWVISASRCACGMTAGIVLKRSAGRDGVLPR